MHERSVQLALTTVLASPKFLFLVEPESSKTDRPLTVVADGTELGATPASFQVVPRQILLKI